MKAKQYVKEIQEYIAKEAPEYDSMPLDEKKEWLLDNLHKWEWEYDPSIRLGSFENAMDHWAKSMNYWFDYTRTFDTYLDWVNNLGFFIVNESWFRVEKEFELYIDHVTKYETKELMKKDSDFSDQDDIF
jgi:hypothetical protein